MVPVSQIHNEESMNPFMACSCRVQLQLRRPQHATRTGCACAPRQPRIAGSLQKVRHAIKVQHRCMPFRPGSYWCTSSSLHCRASTLLWWLHAERRGNNGAARRPDSRVCCYCPESWASTTGLLIWCCPASMREMGNECNHVTFRDKKDAFAWKDF